MRHARPSNWSRFQCRPQCRIRDTDKRESLGHSVHVLRWPPYVVRSQNANVLEEKLHDSASWHAGRKRRYFDGSEPPALCNFVAGLCGRVLRNVSEEDVVHRIEAGKLEKID